MYGIVVKQAVLYCCISLRTMSDSPFYKKKVSLKKEESFLSGALSSTFKSLDDAFISAIPSDDVKALPSAYLYPVGTLIFIFLVAIFVAVFVPGYLTEVRTQFLSPIGSESSKYCDAVTISNTGEFLGTKTGVWEGAPSFTFANGSYVLTVTNYQITPEKFAQDMYEVYGQLKAVGRYTSKNNLGINLLFWTSWTEVAIDSLAQRFAMSGTPLAILNRGITVGTISNVYADCNAPATSTFNPSSGMMEVVYQVSSFQNNPNCSATTSPNLFGYRSYINTDTFSIGFDVRSVFTCVAVNSRIVHTDFLQATIESTYEYRNETYNIAAYVDPRYPGMKPIQCIFFHDNDPVCVLIIGTVYVLPVFNHGGYSFTMPVPCNCSGSEELMNDIKYNKYNLCNTFNFLTGFIFYPYQMDPTPVLDLVFKFPNSTGKTINEAAFTAMFTAGMYGQSSPERASFDTPQQREEMYAFCNSTEFGPCSIVTFTSADETATTTDWVVSTNYYQLETGACSDSFSTSPEAWNKLIEKPFAPLTQQYETCSNDPTTAFLTQAGVSAGNVSILSPLGVIFVLFLLSMYQMASGAKIAKNYTPNEKQAALDALAVALLLVRDKKLEEHEYRSRTSSSSTSGKANDKSNGKGKGGAGGNDGSERSSSLAEEARAYSQYGYGSKKKKDTKNGHLHDGLETSSAGAPVNERKSRVLAEIVEQLAEIAVVAAEDEELYRKRTEDPVYIDWSALGRQVSYMLYGSEEERRRKKQKKQELREESSVTDNDSGDNSGVENRTRGDSAQDDVELTTVSQLHSTVV